MSICSVANLALVVSATFLGAAQAAEFYGWEGFRVMAVEGRPERMFAADLNADGRQELIVVNTRQSRLDVYRWLPASERQPVVANEPDRPNDLPLAPDWSHTEIALDDLPADATSADLDGDGRPELLVVTGPTLKLTAFHLDADNRWRRRKHWDLLSGQLAGRGRMLIVRERSQGKRELLISCEQGIQIVQLDEEARAAWFHPRESAGRLDWRLADLDGDGDEDLLEWTSKANQSVRWYECSEGSLRPPQALHDQSLQQMGCLAGDKNGAAVLCLSAAQSGLVRRYRLSRGEESPYGLRATLPIAAGPGAAWCGLKLDGDRALAAVDATEPKIRTYRLVNDQWAAEESYPTLGGVREIAAPASPAGTLWLWVKDAADLYESRWEKGRLTFPKALASSDVADRKVLALETVGDVVWWVQRVGEHIDLYVRRPEAKEVERTRFEKVGAKAEKVLWLGGKRLLLQQAYAGAAKLVALDNDKAVVTEPPHLAKVNFAEYRLYRDGKNLRVGRLADGVLQWLDDNLQPLDQVMLPDGQKLVGFVPAAEGELLALEQGGQFLHRLKPDAAGIARTTLSIKLAGGVALRNDLLLGLFLIDGDRIIRLSAGKPWELKLDDTIDARRGRPNATKEAGIHRVLTADLTGDGLDDAVLCDDRRHQLTVLQQRDGELRDLVSWQVFEDQTYPYGEEKSGVPVAEPRSITAFDADGDDNSDLALLSQDRLLIYLGREAKP